VDPGTECSFCPAPAEELHHPSGRDHTGEHLDPDFVLPLCLEHHVLVHEDLRHEHLDVAPGPLGRITAVAHRLHRLALFISRFAGTNPESMWARIAAVLRTWADELTSAQLELTHA
jgi:FAD/FMN-containing dehydrogenase